MKLIVIVGLFLMGSATCRAQCKSSFDDNTSQAAIKEMLQCWKRENARLAADLKAQKERTEVPDPKIGQLTAERNSLAARLADVESANKNLSEQNAKFSKQNEDLSQENARLKPVWAVTVYRNYDWNKYPLDSCKLEATKQIVIRKGVVNHSVGTTVDFTINGSTGTVDCRVGSGGYVTVADHTFGPATDLAKDLDDAIFAP